MRRDQPPGSWLSTWRCQLTDCQSASMVRSEPSSETNQAKSNRSADERLWVQRRNASRRSMVGRCAGASLASRANPMGAAASSRRYQAWKVPTKGRSGLRSSRSNAAGAALTQASICSGGTPQSLQAARACASEAWLSSSSACQTRSCISAAALLVKVRARMPPGSAPSSSARTMRAVSSQVLPLPAQASTTTDARGSQASAGVIGCMTTTPRACRPRVRGSLGRPDRLRAPPVRAWPLLRGCASRSGRCARSGPLRGQPAGA